MKVDKFINPKQDNMIVDKYSLKFTTSSRYALSFVSKPKDGMIRFVTGVTDLKRNVVQPYSMMI